MGSASIDLAYVACGRFDAFFEYGLKPWDVAAGTLLIREAGGRVADFSGCEKNITGWETVAANNLVFSEFFEIVSKFMQNKID
jgi:myo-inositol-1(or 4)-monophosphatase